ncbi:MAG TPA: hypothetical protein VIT89_08900 [Solirubrobacterales bacterium]
MKPQPIELPSLHVQAQTASLLATMGLSEEILAVAVRSAYLERDRCTGNDVNAAGGNAAWGKPLRSLRDQLLPKGWHRGGQPDLESVISPDRSFRITSAAGNWATGDFQKMPKTAGLKGRLALDAIGESAQMALDLVGETQKAAPQMRTYYLLHCLDEALEQVRYELSIPSHMSIRPKAKKGRVDEFKHRLILKPIEFETETDIEDHHEEEFSDDLDISIPRRASSE